jgi:hypothetical protein
MTTVQRPESDRPHTKTWNVRVDISEEGDVTRVHAVLDTGDNALRADAVSRRNPDDRPFPEIGEEFAAGRALTNLGHQLLHAGDTDAEGNTVALPM